MTIYGIQRSPQTSNYFHDNPGSTALTSCVSYRELEEVHALLQVCHMEGVCISTFQLDRGGGGGGGGGGDVNFQLYRTKLL